MALSDVFEEGENHSLEVSHTNSEKKASGSSAPISGRCGSKLRRSDPPRYCMQFPASGGTNGRCARYHNGRAQKGFDHWNYSGRGYSKDLPPRLLERLMAGIDDPDLTSMRTEIALLDARMGELLEGLSDTASTEAWTSTIDSTGRLRYLLDRPDLEGREVRLEAVCIQLEASVSTEVVNRDTWHEVYSLIDRRRRTANVELKREELEEHTLRHAQALHFFQQLLAVVHEEVTDPALKQRLSQRLAERMGTAQAQIANVVT